MADINGLRAFTTVPERDEAPFFVGRKEQIGDVIEACNKAMEKIRGGRPVTSPTRLLHGAPGVGKTALLREIERRCTATGDDHIEADAIRVRISCLKDESLLVRNLAEAHVRGGSREFRRNESMAADGGIDVGFAKAAGSVETDLAPPLANFDELTRMYPPKEWLRPVILLVDEIQNATPDMKLMLDDLHQGIHGLPILPVFAGLGSSRDVLSDFRIGLSRMTEDNVQVIQALAPAEARQAVTDMLDCFGVTQAAFDWPERLAVLSDCWPQHLHNGMRALAHGLVEAAGRLSDVNVKTVLERESDYRIQAYRNQISGVMRESIGLVHAVMANLDQPHTGRGDILDVIDAHVDTRSRRWSLPEGMTARGFLDHLIHRGALQEKDDIYSCPIPSFRDFLIEKGQDSRGLDVQPEVIGTGDNNADFGI